MASKVSKKFEWIHNKINIQKFKELEEEYRAFDDIDVEYKYVAFLDILGFSNMLINKFEETLNIYEKVIDMMRFPEIIDFGVDIKMISDSIILVSSDLRAIIQCAGVVQFNTLFERSLVRGGIGYGKHTEKQNGKNQYIASQALVKAVLVEKTIERPCVALHEDIKIPDDWWSINTPPVSRMLHYYEDLNIVNPLNLLWGRSAIGRVLTMKNEYPEYSEKYDWFIKFCTLILEGHQLVPERIKKM